MAKRAFQVATITPTAQADGVLTSSTFLALVGGAASAIIQVMEIYMAGQAAAAGVNAMTFARSSTLGITPTALAVPNTDGYMNANSQVQTTLNTAYVAAGTGPNRSPAATVARLNLSFNPFGGIIRWVAQPGEEWTSVGNATTSNSESVLSAQNVGTAGAMGAHIIYEIL